VFPVRYELGFCISEDGILHSHRRENLKSYSECYLFNVYDVKRSNTGLLVDFTLATIQRQCIFFYFP
jgi:hypothetical protein